MTTVSLVTVGDDTLEAVRADDGAVWIPVRKVCDSLRINADAQLRRLQREPWATTTMMVVVGADGRKREAGVVALKTLPMWLATIEVSRVDSEIAPRLVRFQLEAHDALAAHFGVGTKGSGGLGGSGGVPSVRPAAPVVAAGGDDLDVIERLIASMRADRAAVAVVAARVDAAEAAVVVANARADDAVALAARAMKNSTMAREDARAIRAAAMHVSQVIRAFCAYSNRHDWKVVYSECRRALMLPSSKDKPKRSISECCKRADQVLTYARRATELGVPGLEPHKIHALLNKDLDPAGDNVVDVDTTAPTKATAPC